eukprot:7889778-Pyramimonas_sp.AAC.1
MALGGHLGQGRPQALDPDLLGLGELLSDVVGPRVQDASGLCLLLVDLRAIGVKQAALPIHLRHCRGDVLGVLGRRRRALLHGR